MFGSGLFWILISIYVVGLEARNQKHIGISKLQKKIDMPLKDDLKIFLPYVHDILNFYLDSKNDIDLNLDYGIFLLNVLLKPIYYEKSQTLPIVINYSLKNLFEKNDELKSYFREKVVHDFKPEDGKYKSVLTLYSNESLWMVQMKKFDTKRRRPSPMKESHKQLEKLRNLFEYEELSRKSSPTPFQADYCMRFLAANPINYTEHKCIMPEICIKVLYHSSSVGFALTHRLLLLQLAQFGRRCYMQSVQNDSRLAEKLCKHAYNEVIFLSKHEYEHGDLIFEQMTYCALFGYFDFLRHSWLDQLLRLRTKDGCFAQNRRHHERVRPKEMFMTNEAWTLNRDENKPLLKGLCEASVTSGALTTLVLAVKYILETFY